MVQKKYLITTLVITLLGMAGCKTTSEMDINSVKPTWLYGQHAIPGRPTKSKQQEVYIGEPGLWSDKAQQDVRDGAKIPVVLYMHGCAGLYRFETVADLFGNQGFAVFAPDSFERPG